MLDSYREIRPSPRLGRYVECYWWGESDEDTALRPVLPDGCVDILFTARNGEPLGLNAVGLMTHAQTFDVEPGRSLFGVRFRPGMASAFLPEAALLTDKVEPLENISVALAHPIVDRLAGLSNPEKMAGVMEALLRPNEPPDPAQRALWQLPHGDFSLDRLTVEAGLSARTFRRVCVERAGVPPKYLARIVRFRKAVERIGALRRSAAQPNWAQFAAGCGYYDQAHFIREFEEFANCTPGRFLQSLANRGA
jgi:AraC-like DNA-binding protein